MTPVLVRRILTVFAIAIVLVVAWLIALRIPRTLSVFIIAAFIAFGAAPLVRRLERRMGIPRAAAIAVVFSVLLGALVLLALVIVPTVYEQAVALAVQAPQVATASEHLAAGFIAMLRHTFGNRIALPTTQQMEDQIGASVSSALAGAAGSIGGVVVNTLAALLVGTSSIILSVFFLAQSRDVRRGILSFVPPSQREDASELLAEVGDVFSHFVAGQALLCVIVGAAVWLALAPAHFGFALLVAVVCGIGYAVPFAGMIVAQVAAAILALPQGNGMVAYVTVAIFVIARIADNVLVPKIMADSVGVSPIAIIFAVFAGGELFGLPGLILGIPAAALVRLLFSHFVSPWMLRMQQRDLRAHPQVKVDVTVGEGAAEEVVEVVVPASGAAVTSVPAG